MDKLKYVLITVVLLCGLPLYCNQRYVKKSMNYVVMDGMEDIVAVTKTKERQSLTDDQYVPVIKSGTQKQSQKEDNPTGKGVKENVKPGYQRVNIKPRETKILIFDSPSILQRKKHLVASRNIKASKKKVIYSTQRFVTARKMSSEYLDDYPEYSVTMNKKREEIIPNVEESRKFLSNSNKGDEKLKGKKPSDVNKGNKKLNDETPSKNTDGAKHEDGETQTTEYEAHELSSDREGDMKQEDETSSEGNDVGMKRRDELFSRETETNKKVKRKTSIEDIEKVMKKEDETACKKSEGDEKPKKYSEGENEEMSIQRIKKNVNETTIEHNKSKNETENTDNEHDEKLGKGIDKITEGDYITVYGEKIPFTKRKICTTKPNH